MKRSVLSSWSWMAVVAAVAFLTACGGGATEQSSSAPESEETESELIDRARGIHERVITLDTHNDINVSNFTPARNYATDLGNQVNLPKMEEGGLDVAWFIVFTGQGELDEAGYAAAYDNAIAKFDAIHWLTKWSSRSRVPRVLGVLVLIIETTGEKLDAEKATPTPK